MAVLDLRVCTYIPNRRENSACLNYTVRPVCMSINNELKGSIEDGTQSRSIIIPNFLANLHKFLFGYAGMIKMSKVLFNFSALIPQNILRSNIWLVNNSNHHILAA